MIAFSIILLRFLVDNNQARVEQEPGTRFGFNYPDECKATEFGQHHVISKEQARKSQSTSQGVCKLFTPTVEAYQTLVVCAGPNWIEVDAGCRHSSLEPRALHFYEYKSCTSVFEDFHVNVEVLDKYRAQSRTYSQHATS